MFITVSEHACVCLLSRKWIMLREKRRVVALSVLIVIQNYELLKQLSSISLIVMLVLKRL